MFHPGQLLLPWIVAGTILGCTVPAGVGSRQDAGPSPQSGGSPKRVTTSVMDEPSLFNAKLSSVAVRGMDAVEELLHVGLATLDPMGALVPRLAEAVPTIENGLWKLQTDGRMETRARIKAGARWHDGIPLTADDLLFTMVVGRDRELGAFGNLAYDFIEAVEAPEPDLIVVRWRRPFIEADTMFTRVRALPLPRHILEKPYSEDRASFTELPYWGDEFVGLGPYKLAQWVRGSHLILTANPLYAPGRPEIDEIEVRFISDPNAVIASVLAGSLDVTLGRGLSLEQAVLMRDQWRDGSMEVSPASWIILWPQFLNPEPAVMADIRFRRAAAHAIDRQQLVETLVFGLTSVGHTYLSPRDPAYPTTLADPGAQPGAGGIARYEYDPRRAAALIEDLGYTKGTDGQYRDRGGQRLALEVRTSSGDTLRERLLLAVSDYWQRAGVGVEPMVIPRVQAQDAAYFHTFPAFILSRNPNSIAALTNFHSRAIPTAENGFKGTGGTNYARYASPDLDSLIDRIFVTIPMAERLGAAGQIVHHMADQVNVIGLFYSTDQNMISSRLLHVNARAEGATEAWNAHEWRLRPSAD